MIEARKLQALRDRLARDGKVTFKSTRAEVWVERRILVKTDLNATVVFLESEIERAYELAERPLGPSPPREDPELDRRWGSQAPF